MDDNDGGILYADIASEKAVIEDAKRDGRRRKIIRELFVTEKAFQTHLELIHKYFFFPLRFNCILPELVHVQLFSNIEQIQDVSSTLLRMMEQSTVGQAFAHLGPFLKLYSTYANNHQTAISVLQEWMQKNAAFAEFIQAQEARPELVGLKVNALLITPVQRVPRYRMLLEDLLSHTPPDHHDYQQLQDATSQIKDTAHHINEHIRQHDNFQKMLSIQKSFDSSAPSILQPGRVFIKEGILKKVSRKGGKSHERTFFLFNDVLLYCKPRRLESGGRTYTCCCLLPIKHCRVERVFACSAKRQSCAGEGGVLKITCKDEALVLFSDNTADVDSWSKCLDKAIRKLNDDYRTLRKPSSNKVPLRGRSLRIMRLQQKKSIVNVRAAPRAVRRKWPCLTPFAGGDDRSVCCSPRPRRHAKCPQLCRSAGDGGSVKGGGGSLSHDGGELSTEFPFSSDTVLTRLSAVSDGEVSRCASSGANMDGDASSVDENEALTGCLSDGGDMIEFSGSDFLTDQVGVGFYNQRSTVSSRPAFAAAAVGRKGSRAPTASRLRSCFRRAAML